MEQHTENRTSQRIAINGMGRIGRTLLRILLKRNALQSLVAVNDIMPKENLLYLLKYDSVRGPLDAFVEPTPDGFKINGQEILYSELSELEKLSWANFNIHTVVEATGQFTLQEDASKHLALGVQKVLLTTFSKNIPVSVWGVNPSNQLRRSIIAPGDCTINCVAPIINTIQAKWSIQSLHVNVIQGYTTRQELIDRPYKGLRRGRAAAHSIIPFEVNITPILENIFPSLKNRIQSMSTRVPVTCGAFAELSIVINGTTTEQQVNSLFEDASQKELKNVSTVTFDPIVSSDILNNSHSSVIDGQLTRVTNNNHLRILAWFDNEWGYSNRLFDWLMNEPGQKM